jgi:hypothetical protein
MQCADIAPFIARRADAPETLDATTLRAVDSHVAGCAACRAALDEQRAVAGMLRMRPANNVSVRFSAQLSARLEDASGWFGIADWRRWTLRLTPVAAALALATYLGLGTTSQAPASVPATVPLSVNDWALAPAEGQAGSTRESMLWESGVSAESVLETMLTVEQATNSKESGNVR